MAVFDGDGMVEKCCRCALAIMEEASGRNPDEDVLPTGIGIHAGNVMIGNIGSPEHLDYSIIGANGKPRRPAVRIRAAGYHHCFECGSRGGPVKQRSVIPRSAGGAHARRQRKGSDFPAGRREGAREVHALVRQVLLVHPSRAEIQNRISAEYSRVSSNSAGTDFHQSRKPNLGPRDLSAERDDPVAIRAIRPERHRIPFDAAEVNRDGHPVGSTFPNGPGHFGPLVLAVQLATGRWELPWFATCRRCRSARRFAVRSKALLRLQDARIISFHLTELMMFWNVC